MKQNNKMVKCKYCNNTSFQGAGEMVEGHWVCKPCIGYKDYINATKLTTRCMTKEAILNIVSEYYDKQRGLKK